MIDLEALALYPPDPTADEFAEDALHLIETLSLPDARTVDSTPSDLDRALRAVGLCLVPVAPRTTNCCLFYVRYEDWEESQRPTCFYVYTKGSQPQDLDGSI